MYIEHDDAAGAASNSNQTCHKNPGIEFLCNPLTKI